MKNNKGFSLVELIVVIAIMAILVGVIAPQLIKFIEKSRVSSDYQLLNAIYAAVTYAIEDPEVSSEAASMVFVTNMTTGPVLLESLNATSAPSLYKEVLDTLGWTDLQYNTYVKEIASKHDATNSHIYMQFKGTCDNPIAMWINCTDSAGRGNTSVTVSNYTDTNISKVIAIY